MNLDGVHYVVNHTNIVIDIRAGVRAISTTYKVAGVLTEVMRSEAPQSWTVSLAESRIAFAVRLSFCP